MLLPRGWHSCRESLGLIRRSCSARPPVQASIALGRRDAPNGNSAWKVPWERPQNHRKCPTCLPSPRARRRVRDSARRGAPRGPGRRRRLYRRLSRCWRGWSRCGAGPACISAAPMRRRSTIFSRKFSTMRWTRRSPATPASSRSASARRLLTVSDNGRGIPVDPHPKFPKKSALEVDHDHAARGRQIRWQSLPDLGRPAWRRHFGRQRPVGTARSGSRAGPDGSTGRRSSGATGNAPRKARQGAKPARHERAV